MTNTLRTAEDLTAEEVAEIRLRKENRASVSQVARHLGVSNFTVIQIERGEARRDVPFRLKLPPDHRVLAPEDYFFLTASAKKEARQKLKAEAPPPPPPGPKLEKWARGPLATTPTEFRGMRPRSPISSPPPPFGYVTINGNEYKPSLETSS
jgi:hypothetical protein